MKIVIPILSLSVLTTCVSNIEIVDISLDGELTVLSFSLFLNVRRSALSEVLYRLIAHCS